mmetsp:Transcript_33509/g.76593  ORF Transcript_33509/g.76593 Transcript_33509/m.76593 type:complete len:291 (-) Transcript_33509:344-1216(-)
MVDRLQPPEGMALRSHIIVCGMSQSMGLFVQLLRSVRERPYRVVVVINDVLPDKDMAEFFLSQGQVYFVLGSPHDPRILLRYNVATAYKVVALARPKETCASSSSGAMDDAGVIFIIRWLQSALEAKGTMPGVMVELVHEANVKYIETTAVTEHFETTTQYAAGTVLQSGFSIVMLCQSYYNPLAVGIINCLIKGGKCNGSAVDPTKSVVGSMPGRAVVVKQVDVPPSFVGRRYKELFAQFLSVEDMLPLGLYRGTKEPTLQNTSPYVYTNPEASAVLYSGDRVFVLVPL